MEKKADLHTHTTFSDGKLTPVELIQKAISTGLSAISITDHDSVNAYLNLKLNLNNLNLNFNINNPNPNNNFNLYNNNLNDEKNYNIDIMTGIELSAHEGTTEYHILGYNIDIDNTKLKEHTLQMKEMRYTRAEKMLIKLSAYGMSLSMGNLLALAGDASIGRPHIAELMFINGYIMNIKDAYIYYIGDGCPAYVAKSYYPVKSAIELINHCGGVAVLAHPANNIEQNTLYKFIKYGLDGIEIIHPSHSPYLQKYYHTIASQYWLLETGGSDYHGISDYEELNFGKYIIPYSVVESIKIRGR